VWPGAKQLQAVCFFCTLSKMVYYFTSSVVSPPAFIYVGKDKVESIVPSYVEVSKGTIMPMNTSDRGLE
jgi:hypothetical protein